MYLLSLFILKYYFLTEFYTNWIWFSTDVEGKPEFALNSDIIFMK